MDVNSSSDKKKEEEVLEEVLYSISYSVFDNYDVSMVMFEVNNQYVGKVAREE